MQSRPYDLVIFDCDGVLVDSELLSARVLTTQLAEAGIDLSIEDFQQHFLGRKFAVAVATLEHRMQTQLPVNFQDRYVGRLLDLFETELRPLRGVQQVLQSICVEFCVASSSIAPRLNTALRVAGLERFFGERVYSAAHVENAKPAPDLFLYAAKIHGVAPARCLVIEDSEMGILAARAAGMDVWHFTGGGHIAEGYMLPNTAKVNRVVANMVDVLQLFQNLGLSNPMMPITNTGVLANGT